MTQVRDRLFLTSGFVLGLVLKYRMLFYMGGSDMGQYYNWGKTALEIGLPSSFHGTYFPFQYQIFEICAWLVSHFQIDFVPVFKLSNLLFDTGNLILLIILLERMGLKPIYALLYWLHPWFLAMFSLGYIDFHFTFFVLLSLTLLRTDTTKDFVLSGIPLGIAFFMKPQASVLFVACVFYSVWHYRRTRGLRPIGIFAFSAILLLVYGVYFTVAVFPQQGVDAAYILPRQVLKTANISSMNAHMLNLWYPVAYFMKQSHQPIYAVSDHVHVLPFISARHLGGLAVLALVGFYVWGVEKTAYLSVTRKFLDIFTLSSLALPFIMTSAHENHLFLGSVFLVLFLAGDYPLLVKLAVHLIFILQFVNIYGLYGEHPIVIARFLRSIFSEGRSALYSVLSVGAFILIIRELWRPRVESTERRAVNSILIS